MDIRQAGPEDRERWDAWVEGHAEPSPYHLFAWKEAVERAYGHRGRYLMAFEEGSLVGVLPLVRMTGLLGGRTLVSLPFCDVGGDMAAGPEAAEALWEAALSAAREEGMRFVEVRQSDPGGAPTGQNAKVRMLLRLPGSAEELWASFASKLRSQVRKAEKNGLSFRWSEKDDFGLFYRVFSRNMRDLGSPVHSRAWLRAIVREFGTRCRVGLVMLGDEPVGCGLVLVAGRRVSIPWASTLKEHNRLSPNMLLYWKLLEWSADAGLEVFDFGRSTAGEGTYRFKEQWGARPYPLRWRRVRAGGEWVELGPRPSPVRELGARVWSRLPLGLANVAGPVLRRYISL